MGDRTPRHVLAKRLVSPRQVANAVHETERPPGRYSVRNCLEHSRGRSDFRSTFVIRLLSCRLRRESREPKGDGSASVALVAHFRWDRSVPDGFFGIGRFVKLVTEGAVNLASPIRFFEKTERERLAAIETPARGFAPEAAERESVSQIGPGGLERHDHSQFHAAQSSPPSRETCPGAPAGSTLPSRRRTIAAAIQAAFSRRSFSERSIVSKHGIGAPRRLPAASGPLPESEIAQKRVEPGGRG
jgi:hypothetical protein